MKIPNQLREFRDKDVLMLVAGKQDAVLYHIHGQDIDEIFSFVTLKPEYSDNEAKFQDNTNGRVMSGNIEGYQDEDLIRDFLHDLEERIKGVDFEFREIYLSAPGSSREKIRESLPKAWQEKVVRIEEGNYFKENPLDILKNVFKPDAEGFEPITNEEKKIMSIPEQ